MSLTVTLRPEVIGPKTSVTCPAEAEKELLRFISPIEICCRLSLFGPYGRNLRRLSWEISPIKTRPAISRRLLARIAVA